MNYRRRHLINDDIRQVSTLDYIFAKNQKKDTFSYVSETYFVRYWFSVFSHDYSTNKAKLYSHTVMNISYMFFVSRMNKQR